MENEQNISPNDPDLLLAQKIGEILPNLDELNTAEDELLQKLFQYKQETSGQTYTPNSTAIWNSIRSHLDGSETESRAKALIFQLTPAFRRYAIAASLVMAAFLGSYLYQSLTASTLIGESFAAIEHLTLTDGTKVTLRPYSKLYEDDISDERAEYQLQGEALFEVTKDPDRIFAVVTDRSEVEVLGTKFILSDWGINSTVYLEEGSVRYTSLSTRESVTLKPGESATVSETGSSPSVKEANETIYTDWLHNELVFDNETAKRIFEELEQHFNIRIESSDSITNDTLSGSIELSDLNSVLDDLGLVLEGTFTATGSRAYVFKQDR